MPKRRAGRRHGEQGETAPGRSWPSRRTTGAALGGLAAAALAVSIGLAWHGDAAPRQLPLRHLVQTDAAPAPVSSWWGSLATPLAVAAVLGLAAAAARSRVLLGLAWLAGVTTVALWKTVRFIGEVTGHAADSAEPGAGFWLAAAALVALAFAIAVAGPRREEVEAPLSMFDSSTPTPPDPLGARHARTGQAGALPAKAWHSDHIGPHPGGDST